MIKGKYVGTISISFEFPDDYDGLLPYEELKKEMEKMDSRIKEVLMDEMFTEEFNISIETQESELTHE